ALEILDGLGQQPCADTVAFGAWVNRDAYQVTGDRVDGVKLIANDSCVVLSHHKVGIRAGHVEKACSIVTPKLLEGSVLHGDHSCQILCQKRPDSHLLVSEVWNRVIGLVI